MRLRLELQLSHLGVGLRPRLRPRLRPPLRPRLTLRLRPRLRLRLGGRVKGWGCCGGGRRRRLGLRLGLGEERALLRPVSPLAGRSAARRPPPRGWRAC